MLSAVGHTSGPHSTLSVARTSSSSGGLASARHSPVLGTCSSTLHTHVVLHPNSWEWWCMTVTAALRRQRQQDCYEFKVSLFYLVTSSLVRVLWDSCPSPHCSFCVDVDGDTDVIDVCGSLKKNESRRPYFLMLCHQGVTLFEKD